MAARIWFRVPSPQSTNTTFESSSRSAMDDTFLLDVGAPDDVPSQVTVYF